MSTPPPNRTAPSTITQSLVELLLSRDAAGLKKYGVTLDRDDLTCEQWIDHATEELLDGAGYLQRLKRDTTLMRQTLSEAQARAEALESENARLRAALEPILALTGGSLPAPVQTPAPVSPAPAPVAVQAPAPVATNPAPLATAPRPRPRRAKAGASAGLPDAPPEGCIGTTEAADRMGVTRATICKWVHKGLLSWAGEYQGIKGVAYCVRLADLNAIPAKLAEADKERKETAKQRLRELDPAQQSQRILEGLKKKRDAERPTGALTYEEAAQRLGVTRDTVRVYAKDGKLERIPTGFVSERSVDVYQERRAENLAPPPLVLRSSVPVPATPEPAPEPSELVAEPSGLDAEPSEESAEPETIWIDDASKLPYHWKKAETLLKKTIQDVSEEADVIEIAYQPERDGKEAGFIEAPFASLDEGLLRFVRATKIGNRWALTVPLRTESWIKPMAEALKENWRG